MLVILHYRDRMFEFEPSADNNFDGRLILDEAKRELLQKLEDEYDGWYLDDAGDRWPAEELFSRSPWSWYGPSGVVKLLLRFLDYSDGRTWFSTPDSYGGEVFRWIREPMVSPVDVFRQTLAVTGGDNIAAIRTVRERFGLSASEAKEIMLQSDGTADTLDEHQQHFATPVKTYLKNHKPS